MKAGRIQRRDLPSMTTQKHYISANSLLEDSYRLAMQVIELSLIHI